ncbi:hypothetical protein Q077_06487 [Pseudomonas aeruginosa BL23]|nr:hypothetical protein Q077_06487 [Pseudomonas aeruginosa BL23]
MNHVTVESIFMKSSNFDFGFSDTVFLHAVSPKFSTLYELLSPSL